MATTAVVAEILIVGLEATAWLTLLLLTVFGTEWVDAGALSDFAALTTLGVLAGAYVLGIVVDRAADSAYSGLRELLARRDPDEPKPEVTVPTMRLEVMRHGGPLAAFIDYQRSRLRVIRGTALNLAIGAPVVFSFLWRNAEPWEAFVGAGFVLAGLAASVPAANRIDSAQLNRLEDAYSILAPHTDKKSKKRRDVAAAVTYGFVDSEPRLLLVRTTGGDHWTFPKGKVEKDERGRDAAVREAREEAGVEGTIEDEPFTKYRYRSNGDSKVAAYLLRADPSAELAPSEPVRRPEWVSPEEARARLRAGREQRYAAEHERVLDEALARIAAAGPDRG